MARGFRVYDKLEKRMIDNPASESIFLSGNGNLVNVDHPEIYLMDRYVRMDSTGKTDKQGKEIYESDNLRVSKENPVIYDVVWLDDLAKFSLHEKYKGQDSYLSPFARATRYEVIGNIYEHSYLLDTKSRKWKHRTQLF